MGKIALSYRRADAQAMAYRIFEHLERHFGDGEVFIDMDIPLGADFQQFIGEALRQASVLIVVIGPRWLGARKRAPSRIMEETDPVRIEIEAAREHHLRIVPLLVEGAVMPKPSDLPDSLTRFSYLNAKTIDSGFDFRGQMSTVIKSLESSFATQNTVFSPSPSGTPIMPGDFHGVQDASETDGSVREERERLEAEAAREERERVDAANAQTERERLEAEAAREERERLEAEAAREERERVDAANAQTERERLEAEAAREERERLEAAAAREERERERLEADAIREQRDRLDAEARRKRRERLNALWTARRLADEAVRKIERSAIGRRPEELQFAVPTARKQRRKILVPAEEGLRLGASLDRDIWPQVNDGSLRTTQVSLIVFVVVSLTVWVLFAFTK